MQKEIVMSPESLVLIPVGALLVGVLLILALAGLLSARAKGWIAFASSLVALGGVLALWPLTRSGQVVEAHFLAWDGPAALAYHVDGLSQLFALMATGIGTAILLYSIAYMARDPAPARFYTLMLLFIAGLVNLVYSADLFLLYLSWEIIGLCSFLLVGFWYQQPEAAAGARKVLVMTHLAGYGLLATILLLYVRTGSTLWTDPRVMAAFGSGLFLLSFLAAVAKSVQFPLHTWIPEAMAAPTPVSALLHAACYVKAGVYLIARLHSLGPWPVAWQTLVIWIGTLTLVVGGLYAVVQSDLKRLLAFSTVSQIGYMFLGLGLSTPLGITAGLLHCLNHGLFKGGLFLCAGAVQHATGTRDMDRLGGLARQMPRTTVLWLMLAGSVAGVPLLSGFVSKWLLYNAALEAGQTVPALISWVVSVVTIFYFLKATSSVFLGDETPSAGPSHEAPGLMLAGTTALASLSVILGVAPQLAVHYVINPVLPAMGGLRPEVGVTWLGLTAGEGSWFATGGLILALIAVGVGIIVYWLAQPRHRLVVAGAASTAGGGGVFTGGEPLASGGHLPASDFSLIIRQGLAPFYHWLEVDRYYLALWQGLGKAAAALERGSRWLERYAVPASLILTLLLALVVGLGGGLAGRQLSGGPHPLNWSLLAGTGLALLGLLLAASAISQPGEIWPWMMGTGALTLLGIGFTQPFARLILLEGAALIALILVWRTTTDRAAAHVYLLAILLSAVMTVGGTFMLETPLPELALALLVCGFALKLALIPLYLWLPRVAETTPVLVLGLVVAVVDVAAFGELLLLRQATPWLFTPATPWLALALVSALGGAILMLAQRNLKRFLAFSTIEDMGYLVLGLTLAGELGLRGALLGAIVHAVAKALLFISLVAPEADRKPLTLGMGGLAATYPVSGAGFLVGALAMLGIPPTLGYAARWRLYGVAAGSSPWLLVALLLATALAVLAYARVIARFWWGPVEGSAPLNRSSERWPRIAAVVGLSVILLLWGIWPGLLSG